MPLFTQAQSLLLASLDYFLLPLLLLAACCLLSSSLSLSCSFSLLSSCWVRSCCFSRQPGTRFSLHSHTHTISLASLVGALVPTSTFVGQYWWVFDILMLPVTRWSNVHLLLATNSPWIVKYSVDCAQHHRCMHRKCKRVASARLSLSLTPCSLPHLLSLFRHISLYLCSDACCCCCFSLSLSFCLSRSLYFSLPFSSVLSIVIPLLLVYTHTWLTLTQVSPLRSSNKWKNTSLLSPFHPNSRWITFSLYIKSIVVSSLTTPCEEEA